MQTECSPQHVPRELPLVTDQQRPRSSRLTTEPVGGERLWGRWESWRHPASLLGTWPTATWGERGAAGALTPRTSGCAGQRFSRFTFSVP